MKLPYFREPVRKPGNPEPSVKTAESDSPLYDLKSRLGVKSDRRVITFQKPICPSSPSADAALVFIPEKVQEKYGKMMFVGRVGKRAGIREMRCDAFYLAPFAGRQMEFLHKTERVIDMLNDMADENAVKRIRTDRKRAPGHIRKRIGMGRRVNVEPNGPGLFGLATSNIQFTHTAPPRKNNAKEQILLKNPFGRGL
jgi:hypothetical protein